MLTWIPRILTFGEPFFCRNLSNSNSSIHSRVRNIFVCQLSKSKINQKYRKKTPNLMDTIYVAIFKEMTHKLKRKKSSYAKTVAYVARTYKPLENILIPMHLYWRFAILLSMWERPSLFCPMSPCAIESRGTRVLRPFLLNACHAWKKKSWKKVFKYFWNNSDTQPHLKQRLHWLLIDY